jgi:chorismate synthase
VVLARPSSGSIQLRRLVSIAEYHECERLESSVWGADGLGRVSPLVLITAQENGGLVIGAFADSQLVGFVCSMVGFAASGAVKHCSLLMAVAPQCRGSGIGCRLKLMQRQLALAQGIELITWTFDPLISTNAHLNIHKLGCICSEYMPDHYGSTPDGANAGLPTDRLLVEWRLTDSRVVQRLRGPKPFAVPPGAPVVNEVVWQPGSGMARNWRRDLAREERALLIEVPADIQAIKAASRDLALAWRMEIREIFETYFGRGYKVRGFGALPGRGESRRGYLLCRDEAWCPAA